MSKTPHLGSKYSSTSPARVFRLISILLFTLYLILLVWIIALKCNYKVTITDTYYIFGKMTWSDKLQFARNSFSALLSADRWISLLTSRQDILNVIVFIPFGIYTAYFLGGRKPLRTTAIALLASFTFEALQLITHIGCFSAIDLATNTLGAVIGYFIYRIIYRNEPKRLIKLCIASAIMALALLPLVYSAVARTVDMRDLYIDVLLRRL